MIITLVPACHSQQPDPAHPADPFVTTAVGQLPIGSLAGSDVLLLVVGGVALGDSATGPLADLEPQRAALSDLATAQLDSAVRRDGRGVTWVGLEEQRRAARRSPMLGLDPDHFATAYLLAADVDHIPDPLWGQVRSLAAVTNARFALVPAAARISRSAGGFQAAYIIVVADARTGGVVFRARAVGQVRPTPAAALISAAGTVLATPLR